jgi:hypothetical protein
LSVSVQKLNRLPPSAKSSVRNDDINYVIGRSQLTRRIVLLLIPNCNKGRTRLCPDGAIFKKIWCGSAPISSSSESPERDSEEMQNTSYHVILTSTHRLDNELNEVYFCTITCNKWLALLPYYSESSARDSEWG